MGSIRHTTKKEVLQRTKVLVESSNALYLNRVFVMAGSELPPNIADRDILTVSIAGGSFSYGEQAGGAQFAVPYQGTLRVSLWHTCRTDRQGTDHDALLACKDGLFLLETDILRALLGSSLPGTETHDPILSQLIYAISDTESFRSSDGVFGKVPSGDMAQAVLTVNFGVDFYWDMTAGANR